jgi:plasmid stabilization system protein ParE
MASIMVQPEAEADIAAAHRWYERRRTGLGLDFIDEAGRVFGVIAEDPLGPRARYRETRRVRLRRFPYVALYVVRHDTAYILAVLHERRSPHLFRSRARRDIGDH